MVENIEAVGHPYSHNPTSNIRTISFQNVFDIPVAYILLIVWRWGCIVFCGDGGLDSLSVSFVRLGGRGSQPSSLETAGQPGQDTHMSSDNINIKLAYSL